MDFINIFCIIDTNIENGLQVDCGTKHKKEIQALLEAKRSDEMEANRINAYKPCIKCNKSGIKDGDVKEYVCGASLKKYNVCKHRENIRNIHNIYMDALIQELEARVKE